MQQITNLGHRIPKNLEETMDRDIRLPNNKVNPYLFSAICITICTISGWYISPYLHEQGVIMLYLLAVVLVASRFGMTPAMVTCIMSLIAFDFFIVRPRFSFEPADPQAIFSFIVMFIIAIAMGQLTGRIQRLVTLLELRVARRTEDLRKTNYDLRVQVAKRAEAERKLLNSINNLAELNESLRQFARIASHDLQEPLRSLKGYTDLLERRYQTVVDKRGQRYLSQIRNDAARMENLIESILAHANIRERNGIDAKEEVDLNEVFKEVRSNLRVKISESKTKLESENLPLVTGEKWQLVQLFQNLISNSIRYSGSDKPQVRIKTKNIGRGLTRITVSDNGIGINDDEKEQIFQMFYRTQSHSPITATGSGTGIGLAICKSVVKNHGGEIWVESKPKGGAEFHFTLPLATNWRQESNAGHSSARKEPATI